MRFFLPTLALLGAFYSLPLLATSVIPFAHLGEATTYSECVVLARASASSTTQINGTQYQDMRFESLETVKGTLLPGTEFVLRPLSYQKPPYRLDITGDFQPETGKTYLLFLYAKEDFWRPVMLSYYVFEQITTDDDAYLIPVGGAGIEAVHRPDGQSVQPLSVFRSRDLLSYMRAFAQTSGTIWDAHKGLVDKKTIPALSADRAVPNGCNFTLGGPNLSRWQDVAVPIFYDDTNVPAGWGGNFANILSAMTDNYTGIVPSDAGEVSYVPDCADGAIGFNSNFIDFCDNDLNGPQSALIIFDDPCDEIPNLSGCAGTLAFGGSYSSSSTHFFDGMDWDDALYGFVVVNNGTPGCMSSADFEIMMTHELTHVYRMGHLNASNFPNQNMNPICCNAINTKDRECMNYAYPSPAPVELISFSAEVRNEETVLLTWATATEKDNAYFSILRSISGTQYHDIQRINSNKNPQGGQYQWEDKSPLKGQNYYLLSQTDLDGKSQHLSIRAVTVGANTARLQIQPQPVRGNTLSFTIILPNNFEGVLEVVGMDGQTAISQLIELEKGLQSVQQPMGDLPNGIYLLHLYDGQQQWSARFLKN